MDKYARLGVKYYIVYNPEHSRRDRHNSWELYQLVEGRYQLQKEEPFWIAEIGLGIGRARGEAGGITREWLAWYDRAGNPYPIPEQIIRRERQRAEQAEQALDQERQRAEQAEQALDQERREKLRLLEQLRQLGLDRG